MPAPKTLSFKLSLRTLRRHIVFTVGPLRVFDVTKDDVPIYEGFLTRWGEVHAMELALADAIELAKSAVLRADIALNAFAIKVAGIIRGITGEPHNSPSELFKLFFAKKNLSAFNKPRLGRQYRAMLQWPHKLETCGYDQLKALVTELLPLLAAAEQAIDDQEKAETAKKIFREIGERRKLFDDVNAGRKSLYGDLSSLPHNTPGLPSDFAEQFFLREVPEREEEEEEEEEEEPTLESVAARIKELTAELEAQNALYKELEEAAKREEEQAKQIRSDEETLAELEKEAAAKQKAADELRASLAERKGTKP